MNHILKITFAFLIAITALSINDVQAQRIGRWEKLGQRKVNMRADHDEILVTRFEGAFTKLKFRVKGAAIHVRNIRVIFGSGADMNIPINKRIPAGAESRVIDLPGNKRIIRKINLNYKTVPNARRRATVVAWGRH